MFIINKSEEVQRTKINGNKQDVKPGEIVEVTKEEGLYVTKAYGEIFGVSEEAKKRKQSSEKKTEAPKKNRFRK